MQRKIPVLSPRTSRILALALGAGVVLTVFLIAAGLDNLRFLPGIPFEPEVSQGGQEGGGFGAVPWEVVQAILLIMAVLIGLSFLIMAREKDTRRKVARGLGLVLVYILVYVFLTSIYQEKPPEEQALSTEPFEQEAPPAPGSEDEPPPATGLPEVEVQSWTGYLVTLGVILGIGGLGYYLWWKSRPVDLELKDITLAALKDLGTGRNWDDVVIQCYAQMSAAAGQTGHLTRPAAMTPSEFSQRLEKAGIPSQPVRSLTRLFEAARYGSRHSSTNEVAAARACLTDILAALEQRE